MRSWLKTFSLAALAAFWIANPCAAKTDKGNPAVVDLIGRQQLAAELLAITNIADGVESWRQLLLRQQSFEQCGCKLSPDMLVRFKDGWHKAVSEDFNNGEIVAELESATAAALSADELRALLKFRKSDLGLKVSEGEKIVQAHSRDGDQAAAIKRISDMASKLEAEPLRKSLVAKIADELGGVRSVVDGLINISIGTAIGAMSAAPPDRTKLSEGEIVAVIEGLRPRMEQQFKQVIVPVYAELVDSLTKAELKAYMLELKSPLARKWTALSLAVFNASLRTQAVKVGTRLAKEIEGQKI